jgi:hypothetical protein
MERATRSKLPNSKTQGKGAAIGALAGGGAGTAAAGFTGKKDIVLPAETRLHFKLVQPVSIQPGS